MRLSRVGATGLVAAVIGALALPVAALVVARTDVGTPLRFLPLVPALVLVVAGAAAALSGLRCRRR